ELDEIAMKTYYAPAERAGKDELTPEIVSVSEHPVINTLLGVVSGLLAVLNEHRQILALNESLLAMIGVEKAEEDLGLRPGESLGCVHALEMPGGCGTSAFCSTCGAAIAIVTSLEDDRPAERTCALTVQRGEGKADLYLRVRSNPVVFNGRRLLLLFIQDITHQQRWTTMERIFFHDLNNTLNHLAGVSELMEIDEGRNSGRWAKELQPVVQRLIREVKIQQTLVQTDMGLYRPVFREVSVRQVFDELRRTFQNHPLAKDRRIEVPEAGDIPAVRTDLSLLLRILDNMLINAFEASEPGEEVRVRCDRQENGVAFSVWNRRAIPEDVARRIFQRNFSTKQDIGRGLGTYSMKLFGEGFLGGNVDFTTSKEEGTTFRIVLPV
ncbi:MAG: HAMP domain-containing histidine kinase, partial [Deltaproteobacteria bacterium]|nr:HAMP domain-containing histidine kinase [Deltaproteobacteria bacterium]